GRGLPVVVSYVYDNHGWGYTCNIEGICTLNPPSDPAGLQPTQKFRINGPLVEKSSSAFKNAGVATCQAGQSNNVIWTAYEGNGTTHTFPPVNTGVCGSNPGTIYAIDGSGYALQFTANSTITNTVIAPNGTRVYGKVTQPYQSVMEDANGNQIIRATATPANVTDTLGHTVQVDLTYNSGTQKYELPYYDSDGTQQKIIVTKSNV